MNYQGPLPQSRAEFENSDNAYVRSFDSFEHYRRCVVLAAQTLSMESAVDRRPHDLPSVGLSGALAIQKKVDGQEITSEQPQDGGGKIIDLMEALKASLARAAESSKASHA